MGFRRGNKSNIWVLGLCFRLRGCDFSLEDEIWTTMLGFGPHVTIESAPRSVMKQDVVDIAIMQRQNPTNLDMDAYVVV